MGIQLDMFEVQLGAGVLLQFRTETGVVRVLADAGVTAKGYPKDRVHSQLPAAFAAFGDDNRRIDLIIGTHYDADHLLGLPPIIADQTYDIGEIWLPPVANDAETHATDTAPDDHNLLALQLKTDETGGVLNSYLRAKAAVCEAVQDLEYDATALRQERLGERVKMRRFEQPLDSKEGWQTFFDGHLADCRVALGQAARGHADDSVPDGEAEPRPEAWGFAHSYSASELKSLWRDRPDVADAHGVSLAFIRESAAKDAINALALDAVVTAAKRRNLPIRCATIPDGQPRRFIWQEVKQRFEPNERQVSSAPELLLLGPSGGLVKKHWDRLPISSYLALMAYTPLPVKSITPSNQLSYVCVFRFAEQRLLISGDAGFVDFRPRARTAFYPRLIAELKALDVIQIAHHGGLNHSFYNCLLAAKMQEEPRASYLLLSHAYHDTTRPSPIFGQYIAQVRDGMHDPMLLFTSEPSETRVRDFKDLIAKVVGPASDVGDVRLVFSKGVWTVSAHAVHVP